MEREPDAEARRQRQLEIYERGLLKVTIECPQCGYLEREFVGPESLGQ
jgi:hypothetical protein